MKAVVYGIGKFAEYILFVLREDSPYEVAACCVDRKFKEGANDFSGLPLYEFETIESMCSPDTHKLFVAVGNNIIRKQVFDRARGKGYSLLSYVSSKAVSYHDTVIGENVFIGMGSVIQPFVSIGSNSLLICARIAHHSRIGENCLLSACTLAGNVTIGNNSFLGVNASVKQGITIGSNNIVGMGCPIVRDTSDGEVYTINKSVVKRKVPSSRLRKSV